VITSVDQQTIHNPLMESSTEYAFASEKITVSLLFSEWPSDSIGIHISAPHS